MLYKSTFSALAYLLGISLSTHLNAGEFSCPPHDSFLTCSKAVATYYKNCSDEAKKVYEGEKLNQALESCKFEAKNNKIECHNKCSNRAAPIRVG